MIEILLPSFHHFRQETKSLYQTKPTVKTALFLRHTDRLLHAIYN